VTYVEENDDLAVDTLYDGSYEDDCTGTTTTLSESSTISSTMLSSVSSTITSSPSLLLILSLVSIGIVFGGWLTYKRRESYHKIII